MAKAPPKRSSKVASLFAAAVVAVAAAQALADVPNAAFVAAGGEEREAADGACSSPVKSSSRLTSPFGKRRGRRSNRPTFHAGVDFKAEKGDPVFAARAGVVDIVVRDKRRLPGFRGYGNAVVVYHPDEDLWSLYAHLSAVEVKAGQVVTAGEIVGAAGNTSNNKFKGMGVHLHFEVRARTRKGRRPFPGRYRVNSIDPQKWLASHGVMYDERGRLIEGPPRVARLLTEPAFGRAQQ